MRRTNLYLGHVFLASFAILSYEILLTRIFSVSQWSHLFFLVISLALFGLAASGTVTAMLSSAGFLWSKFIDDQRWPAALCNLQALAIIGSYLGLNALPLDYYRLSLEPIQLVYLLAAYLMLAAPFLAAGLVVSAAYAAKPRNAGSIYFATMVGSAGGAAFPLLLTPLFGEPVLVVITALLSILVLPLYMRAFVNAAAARPRQRVLSLWAWLPGMLAAVFSAFLLSPAGRSHIGIRSSEYKGLNQALRFPDTRVVESQRGVRGHIDRVTGPYLRSAPGLSLNYQGRLPAQQVVFTDRDVPFTLYGPHSSDILFSTATLSYAAYEYTGGADRILVIPQNGGLSLACALSSGAAQIDIAIRHPGLARMVGNHYGLTVTAEPARIFLARTPIRYDIIQIENWGSTIPGADALTQNHSLTVNAFEAYLKHLEPDGVLTVSRRLILPPSDSLRLWATAYEALTRIGAPRPMNHIAVLRNWDTYTLLVARKPIQDPGLLLDFADRHSFDIVYLSSASGQQANRFNVLPQPYYALGLARLADAYGGGDQEHFFNEYLLDVAPQSDLRPFPGRMLKWTAIGKLYKSIGKRLNSLFLSGEMVVGVTLIEALAVTALLLWLPQRVLANRSALPSLGRGSYFFGLGCGFMLLEIYLIHWAVFFLGDATIGFAVVVTGLLVFSGLGGLLSRRWPLSSVRIILPGLVALLLLQLIGHFRYLEWVLELDAAFRFALIFLWLMPFGLLMGMPFPMGIRHIAIDAATRTYAWSVNGCASVLSAIMAAQLAISFGISYLLIGSAIAYAISFIGANQFIRKTPVENIL